MVCRMSRGVGRGGSGGAASQRAAAVKVGGVAARNGAAAPRATAAAAITPPPPTRRPPTNERRRRLPGGVLVVAVDLDTLLSRPPPPPPPPQPPPPPPAAIALGRACPRAQTYHRGHQGNERRPRNGSGSHDGREGKWRGAGRRARRRPGVRRRRRRLATADGRRHPPSRRTRSYRVPAAPLLVTPPLASDGGALPFPPLLPPAVPPPRTPATHRMASPTGEVGIAAWRPPRTSGGGRPPHGRPSCRRGSHRGQRTAKGGGGGAKRDRRPPARPLSPTAAWRAVRAVWSRRGPTATGGPRNGRAGHHLHERAAPAAATPRPTPIPAVPARGETARGGRGEAPRPRRGGNAAAGWPGKGSAASAADARRERRPRSGANTRYHRDVHFGCKHRLQESNRRVRSPAKSL